MPKDKKIIEQLKSELEKTKKEAQEYLNGWKRAKADYMNRENEFKKEKESWLKFANKKFLLENLPVYDNLKKAIKNIPKELEKDAWAEGISNIKKQYEDILTHSGVEEIKTVGEKFDPELHEAVDGKGSQIKQEVEPGYKLHDKVIKPAKVVVG